MNNLRPKDFYRRNLPHYQPPNGVFFVTFRLDGSLPREVVQRLKEERDAGERRIGSMIRPATRSTKWREFQSAYFEKFDTLLDGDSRGPLWLREREVASIVAGAIRYYDGSRYEVFAYTIMPNHVHLVCQLLPESASVRYLSVDQPSAPYILTSILQGIKKYSAGHANKVLGRTGRFWQAESYDHLIRDGEELEKLLKYVVNNPVKAGLCVEWEAWPWTYVKEGLL